MTATVNLPGLAEDQRVLAAIVFTDITAYSARMHHDEARTIRLAERDLNLIAEICKTHGGQVLKSTGDGLLMFFSSAQAAVATALAAQQNLADLTNKLPPQECLMHRIGIHLGDIYVHGQEVMGDGVNVAQRLLDEAEPGGICFSQTVYDVIKNRMEIKATYLGPRELKNISEAVPVYQVQVFTPLQSTILKAVYASSMPKSHADVTAHSTGGSRGLILASLISSLLLGGLAIWLSFRGGPTPLSGGVAPPATTLTAISTPTSLPLAGPLVQPTGIHRAPLTSLPDTSPASDRPLPTPAGVGADMRGKSKETPPLPTATVLPTPTAPTSQPASRPVPLMNPAHFQDLYLVLQDYAQAHEGLFPKDRKDLLAFDHASEQPRFAGKAWEDLDLEKAFAYQGGFRTTDPEYLVLGYRVIKDDQGQRLVLFLNGQVRLQTVDQLKRALERNLQYQAKTVEPSKAK